MSTKEPGPTALLPYRGWVGAKPWLIEIDEADDSKPYFLEIDLNDQNRAYRLYQWVNQKWCWVSRPSKECYFLDMSENQQILFLNPNGQYRVIPEYSDEWNSIKLSNLINLNIFCYCFYPNNGFVKQFFILVI